MNSLDYFSGDVYYRRRSGMLCFMLSSRSTWRNELISDRRMLINCSVSSGGVNTVSANVLLVLYVLYTGAGSVIVSPPCLMLL